MTLNRRAFVASSTVAAAAVGTAGWTIPAAAQAAPITIALAAR